MQKQRK